MANFVNELSVESLLKLGSLVHVPASTTTVTNGSLVLSSASFALQFFTGMATGFSISLPDATTLSPGQQYQLVNRSSQPIEVFDGFGNNLFTLSQTSVGYCTLQVNSTAAGQWTYWQVLASSTASGIINYNLSSTTPFATSSTTDVAIPGFSIIPQAGTYAIWYNASILYTTTPISHYWSFYKGGVQISDSQREQLTSRSNQVMVDSTMAIAQFDGFEALDVRVRRGTSGTLTVKDRSLILIRLGP